MGGRQHCETEFPQRSIYDSPTGDFHYPVIMSSVTMRAFHYFRSNMIDPIVHFEPTDSRSCIEATLAIECKILIC